MARSLTTWTTERLTKCFARYRQRYWPTSRRLRAYRIEVAELDQVYGQCEFGRRLLLIDIAAHPSDREVRSTLLHEMAHAVVGRGGHGGPFWTQLENLLIKRAPITVSFPELGERGQHACVIPSRFPRCRRLFAPVYRKQQRALEKAFKGKSFKVLTMKDYERECEDWAIQGILWQAVWTAQARQWGFVDLDGRIPPWARKYYAACRRGYRRGRRFSLDEQRARMAFGI